MSPAKLNSLTGKSLNLRMKTVEGRLTSGDPDETFWVSIEVVLSNPILQPTQLSFDMTNG